ncbi:MAG: sugar phosphate isomerase/epimerase family protein [Candidatus Acidiferrales bacterium]|jgi:sugar phosphate isomerase/epimerase
MERVLSTYRYIAQPLSLALIGEAAGAGIKSVEVFCDHSHFNYRSPQSIRDLGDWLSAHGVTLHSLHSPTERESSAGRDSGSPISICDPERTRRLDAVDEVKRAVDVAERLPFRYLVQHMGHGRQSADPRKLDAAFNSLEHLVIFAKQRGVTIALENTPSEMGSPETLQTLIRETHLKDLRFCFDFGHAHIEEGVAKSFEIMSDRIVTTHIHDNHGDTDEHLLPFDGTIDWDAALRLVAAAPNPLPFVIELKEHAGGSPAMSQIRAALDKLEHELESEKERLSEN